MSNGRFAAAFEAGKSKADKAAADAQQERDRQSRAEQEFDEARIRWLNEVGIPVVEGIVSDMSAIGVTATYEAEVPPKDPMGTARAVRINLTRPPKTNTDYRSSTLLFQILRSGALAFYKKSSDYHTINDFAQVDRNALSSVLERLLKELGEEGI